MFEVSVKGVDGGEVGKVSVSKAQLGGCVRHQLLKDAVVAYEAHDRVGTASVKTRAMIVGSTKKIYRQKGTGRARHGSRKVNIFRGGGVTHGPIPRNYGGVLPKRQRRMATASALFSKFRDDEVRVLDRLAFTQPKTARMEETLGAIGVEDETVLIVLPDSDDAETGRNVYLSARNMPGVAVLRAQDVNARDLLVSRLTILSSESLKHLTERVGRKAAAEEAE